MAKLPESKFLNLQIGDSFDVAENDLHYARHKASMVKKFTGRKFKVSKKKLTVERIE